MAERSRQAFTGAVSFRDLTTRQFQTKLKAVSRSLEKQMMDYVSRFTLSDGKFVGNATTLARLANARREIDRMLIRSGYTGAVRDFVEEKFPELSRRVDSAWKRLGVTAELSKTSERALEIAGGLQLDQFANLGARASDRLKRGLMESVTGGAKWSNWAEDLRDSLFGKDRAGVGMFAHAGTLARTAIDQINRLTAKRLGEDAGIEFYLYFGGLIETSREFCQERDGLIFHVDEIALMDNGQTSDVFISAGGYNCRHEWLPVLLEDVPPEVIERVKASGIEIQDEAA